jgi:hypothetical protein
VYGPAIHGTTGFRVEKDAGSRVVSMVSCLGTVDCRAKPGNDEEVL